jgi:hypothetical protein
MPVIIGRFQYAARRATGSSAKAQALKLNGKYLLFTII